MQAVTYGLQDLYHLGLALDLQICRDGLLAKSIKKDMARMARKAAVEFRKAREGEGFVRKLIAREVQLPAKMAQIETMHEYVDVFRKEFKPLVIHRSIKSVDWQGQPIAGLPPLVEQVLALQPSRVEKEALLVMADEIINDENATKSKYLNRPDNVSVRFTGVRLHDLGGDSTRPGRVRADGP